MSRLTVNVALAPYIQEEALKLAARFKDMQDTVENRVYIEAQVSYRLHSLIGVPPGTFVITARSEDE